jgi:hypothetical protein
MLMRYHWGLAVGHVYGHGSENSLNAKRAQYSNEAIDILEARGENEPEPAIQIEEATIYNEPQSDDEVDAEFGLESRDAEELLVASEGEESESEDDDERLLEMDEMYNS